MSYMKHCNYSNRLFLITISTYLYYGYQQMDYIQFVCVCIYNYLKIKYLQNVGSRQKK